MSRRANIIACLCAISCPAVAPAQQYLGELASGCGQLAAGAPLSTELASKVAIDDLIVVAVAARADYAGELGVRDSSGNVYRPRGSARSTDQRLVTAVLSGSVGAKLATGDALTIESGAWTGSVPACFSVSHFREVAGGADAQDAAADGIESAGLLHLQTSTRRAVDTLTLASFALAGDPGALTPGGATLAPVVCHQSQPLCLVRAHLNEQSPGVLDISISATNSQPWAGALSVFYAREQRLRDGFE